MSGHISRELRSTNKKIKKSSKTKNTERTKKIKKTKKAHKTRNTEIETERVSQDLVQDSLQTSTPGNSNLVSNTEQSILGEKDANEPHKFLLIMQNKKVVQKKFPTKLTVNRVLFGIIWKSCHLQKSIRNVSSVLSKFLVNLADT